MQADYRATSYYAHMKKKVEVSRLLDDMEDLSHWRIARHSELIDGAPMDSRGIDTGTLMHAEREGRKVARLTCPVDCTEQNKDYGRGWGLATLFRDCGGEDWSEYNRIVFDVFPHLPGFRTITLCIYLYNTGKIIEPNDMAREGLHFVSNLKSDQWNTVEWEIPELGRDHVKGISIQYRMQGAEPGACEEVLFDFTNLRIERVDCDHAKGWVPKTGEIVFSHTGYVPQGAKTAIGAGLAAKNFEVIRSEDGLVVYEGSVQSVSAHTGDYQVLDFTDLQESGRFFIKAGDKITRPFSIAEDVWRTVMEKTLNFFYAERCGYAVPGVHDICHADFQCRHGNVTKVINGGWHDAGDVSQGLANTTEATYAMLELALKIKDHDPALYETCLEEARWGGDWVLKTRFSDGYRASWLCLDLWSNGVLGDYDDIIHTAVRRAEDNFLCAATEALGARVWKELDAPYALRCLKAAKEDYAWALEDMPSVVGSEVDLNAQACIAAIELYKATGCEEYLAQAEAFADVIPQCQQTELPDWEKPMRGFFYMARDHRHIVHSAHKSAEHGPLVALERMYEFKPKAEYRRCMALYAEYIKTMTDYTAPYKMIPAAIYDLNDIDAALPSTFNSCSPEDAEKQIRNGIRLSDTHYLHLFPVWYSFRGNSGVMLTMARGVLACANVLKDEELRSIVAHALEWQVGRNPFNQSLIWGEGYNFTPQYSALSGDIVGSFSVGVEAQYNEDVPYYPHANCYNYKEVWVFPALRWLDIVANNPEVM